MTKKEQLEKFSLYIKEIQKHCKKQDECTNKCLFYDGNGGCVLYGTPDLWKTHELKEK